MTLRSLPLGAAAGAFAAFALAHPAGAAPVRPLSAAAASAVPVAFDVKLPVRNGAELDSLLSAQSNPKSPMYRHFLTPAQFRAEFAPTAAAMTRAAASLRSQGFSVASGGSQLLRASGTAAGFSQAFKVQLGVATAPGGHLRIAVGNKPQNAALTSLGATVIAFGPAIKPRPLGNHFPIAPNNRYSATGGYWFDDLKQAYGYPAYSVANGSGVTIATVGEADYSSSDAALYFAHEKLGPGGLAPAPKLEHLILQGGAPFDPNSDASFEADLDVQQSGGSAPGATILGISELDADGEFFGAYSYLDDTNVADIVSTSYGECELYFTAAYNDGVDETGTLQAYHDYFRQGNAEGITFLFSSGDNSGKGCFPLAYFGPGTGGTYPTLPGAGIWVDDPDATGVGGTNLLTTAPAVPAKASNPNVPPLPSNYVSENDIADTVTVPFDIYGTGNFLTGVLWGSGDGQSVIFPKPAFQLLASVGTGRTSPDVSMHMGGCPNYGPGITVDCGPDGGKARDSFDLTYLGGKLYGAIGTSASSPEFAGALAVIESDGIGRLGNVNPLLYQLAAFNVVGQYFHQGIPTYNGIQTTPAGFIGYSNVVGNGTPIVSNILRSFGKPVPALAGNPQTPSNP